MSSEQSATIPRWLPLLGGILGSTTCGLLLYAWSVFIRPLNAEFGWTRAEIALAFGICCFVFGMCTIPAGRLSDKIGPRKVVLMGAVVTTIGFVACGFINSLMGLYFTYGVICGIGGGLLYLPPIATGPKWWPDRRALATGFSVVGLGLGSFIMAPIATWIIENHGWRNVFIWVGIAMGILAVLSGLCLQNPPAGWKPAGWSPPPPPPGASAKSQEDYTHDEAKATPQFWMLYAAYFCSCFSGLMVVGHLAGVGIDRGLEPMAAAGAVSVLAFSNAIVRIVIGGMADKFGTKPLFLSLWTVQVVMLLLIYPVAGNATLLWVVALIFGWNYGAQFTLFPSTTLQYYGAKFQGANYGLLFSAFGVAGLVGPWAGGALYRMQGNYSIPFIVAAVVMAISLILLAIAKPPPRR